MVKPNIRSRRDRFSPRRIVGSCCRQHTCRTRSVYSHGVLRLLFLFFGLFPFFFISILNHFFFNCLALPCLALPCHASPCLAKPGLAKPRRAKPSLAMPGRFRVLRFARRKPL